MSFSPEKYETDQHLEQRYADERVKRNMKRVPTDVPYHGVVWIFGFICGVIVTLILWGVK